MIDTFAPPRLTRSHIQPVSRVWFELSDTDAFNQCIKLSLEWMSRRPSGSIQPRSGVAIPPQAWQGEAFDVTDELGANPTKAVRLEARDGALWSARLDWPDPSCPRSWVSEFFVEKRLGHMTRFGAQVTCVRRDECPPFEITRPNVVQRILRQLAVEADGRTLVDKIEPTQGSEVNELISLLYDEARRLPVIVLSETDCGETELSANKLAQRIGGAAHIAHLTREATSELMRLMGRRMSVFNGAVRLYQPGLTDLNEDQFSHPLWLRQAKSSNTLINQISNRVLQSAFLDRSESIFPRYGTVREAVKRQASQSTGATPAPQAELAQALILAAEYSEERDEWFSIAQEEQDRRIDAEKEIERLKVEILRLEYKIDTFEFRSVHFDEIDEEPKQDRSLKSYDDLEDWSDEVLGDAVYIHEAALKDCRKNGHENTIRKIESALLIMRDHMTPARRDNDNEQRVIAKKKLGELGVDDSACFSDREEAKRRPQYLVKYDNDHRVLNDHLKYGTGYNNANQFRIYYFWDDKRKRHVIGKMPSHLPNNLTN